MEATSSDALRLLSGKWKRSTTEPIRQEGGPLEQGVIAVISVRRVEEGAAPGFNHDHEASSPPPAFGVEPCPALDASSSVYGPHF